MRGLAVLLSILLKATLFLGGLNGTGADPSGFVSLDCGGASTNYTEEGLTWIVDDGFGLEGVSKTGAVDSPILNPPSRYNMIRYFTGSQSKYCYVFDDGVFPVFDDGVGKNQVYLVRASFWLGGGSIPFSTPNPYQISFQLLINSDIWDNISISLPQTDPVVKEVYVNVNKDNIGAIFVCLARHDISIDTPFISSLELRPLPANLEAVQRVTKGSQALFLHSRVNYGSSSGNDIRFPGDKFDRIWTANTTGPLISATGTFNVPDEESVRDPPDEVLGTALLSRDNSTLKIVVNVFTGGEHPYFFTLYFFEVSSDVTGPGQRAFKGTTIDSEGSFVPSEFAFVPYYLQLYYNYDDDARVDGGGFLEFDMEKLPTATYGPFITAIEVFRISDQEMSLGANKTDGISN